MCFEKGRAPARPFFRFSWGNGRSDSIRRKLPRGAFVFPQDASACLRMVFARHHLTTLVSTLLPDGNRMRMLCRASFFLVSSLPSSPFCFVSSFFPPLSFLLFSSPFLPSPRFQLPRLPLLAFFSPPFLLFSFRPSCFSFLFPFFLPLSFLLIPSPPLFFLFPPFFLPFSFSLPPSPFLFVFPLFFLFSTFLFLLPSPIPLSFFFAYTLSQFPSGPFLAIVAVDLSRDLSTRFHRNWERSRQAGSPAFALAQLPSGLCARSLRPAGGRYHRLCDDRGGCLVRP